jgi:hypothetical protein
MTVARTRRRGQDSGARPQPWDRFVEVGGCACDPLAPCLLHFAGLDWQGRALAWDRAGVRPPSGR